MVNTYYSCSNLTGSPVCGKNVVNMAGAYSYCNNITGSPVCGENVINMAGAYSYCNNLIGNAYFYSSIVDNARSCFRNKNNDLRLNLYIPNNSKTNNTVHYNNTLSLIGGNITWSNASSYQYNTKYNIYIYPVSNVAAAAIANGDEEANTNAGIKTTPVLDPDPV